MALETKRHRRFELNRVAKPARPDAPISNVVPIGHFSGEPGYPPTLAIACFLMSRERLEAVDRERIFAVFSDSTVKHAVKSLD